MSVSMSVCHVVLVKWISKAPTLYYAVGNLENKILKLFFGIILRNKFIIFKKRLFWFLDGVVSFM